MVRHGFYHDPAAAAVAAAALSVLLSVLLFSSLECACLSAWLPTFACFSAIAAEAVSAVILCGIIERCRFCCWLIYSSYLTLVSQLSPMCCAAIVHSIPPCCQLYYTILSFFCSNNETELPCAIYIPAAPSSAPLRRSATHTAASSCQCRLQQQQSQQRQQQLCCRSFVRWLARCCCCCCCSPSSFGLAQSNPPLYISTSAQPERSQPACQPASLVACLLARFMTVGWSVGRSVGRSFVRSFARSLARSLAVWSFCVGWMGRHRVACSLDRSFTACSVDRATSRQAGSLV